MVSLKNSQQLSYARFSYTGLQVAALVKARVELTVGARACKHLADARYEQYAFAHDHINSDTRG